LSAKPSTDLKTSRPTGPTPLIKPTRESEREAAMIRGRIIATGSDGKQLKVNFAKFLLP